MTARSLIAIIVAGLLLAAAPTHARERPRDLGPIPANGVDAAATIPERAKRVILELACGSEPRFLDAMRKGPDDRPIEMLNAKAAVMAGMVDPDHLQCGITQVFFSDEWEASILAAAPQAANPAWTALKASIDQLNTDINGATPPPDDSRAKANAEAIKLILNKLAMDTFGQACDSIVSNAVAIVHPKTASPGWVEYRVTHSLSWSCMERQINMVILARDLVRTSNPGSSGLPCMLAGKAPHGDWDMAVAQFTRLVFLLRKAGTLRALSAESGDAMNKLQQRLLTLSGGPAEEVHELWQCGNPDNQYGSARDRLDDNDFYDPDLGKDVEGDGEGGSFWKDLLGALLLALALLLAGLALAAIAGILAALFGPAIAALVMAALAVIAVVEDIPQLIAGALFGGIEETENHLFMQNSSKYLKNEMLIEDSKAIGDDDAVDDYQDYQEELREWFMKRLHRVAVNDFAEFNAKPYGRLSFTALLNIHDFSCSVGVPVCTTDDQHLATAVAAVADLTAAKMALGSDQGRRIAPFRRLSYTNTSYTIGKLKDDGTRTDPYRLTDLASDADHWIAAMQVWTGQTFHGPEGHASQAGLSEMLWESTSSYRPHWIILDVALDKSRSYQQTYHHAGWERYSSGPGWLITAGGTESGYAQGFRTPLGTIYPTTFIKYADRGAGVPTTLMASTGKRLPACEPACTALPPARFDHEHPHSLFSDLIRFEGKVVHWKKDGNDEPMSFNDNFCVIGGFGCGINMKIPPALEPCLQKSGGISTPSPRVFSVIDSSTCEEWDDGDAADDYYVIVYRQPCKGGSDCKTGANWGFIEVVTKGSAPTVAALQAQVLAGNSGNFDAMSSAFGKGTLTYNSIANGVITFVPHGSYVTDVSGVAQAEGTLPGWPRASGDIVNRIGDGHYTIKTPSRPDKIEIDFSNEKDPKRVLPP